MEQSMMEWIVTQVGLAGLAAFSIFIVKQTYQDALRREQDSAQSHREDKTELIGALKENASAMTALKAAIDRIVQQNVSSK